MYIFVSIPGESNVEVIQENIQKAINGKYALFCLGFGFDVSYKFLEKMALSNGGIARRIYENADAALQLQVRTKEYARKNIYRLWFMSSLSIFPEIKSWVLVYLMILGREGSSLGASEGLYPNHDSSPPQITVWTNPETHTFLYLCKKDRLSRGSDDKKTSHLGSYSKPLEAPPLEAVCYGFPKTQQVVSGTYRQTGSAIPPA